MSDSSLCFRTATEISEQIQKRQLSSLEVVEAHLKQIETWNPAVNAIVTQTADLAIEQARAADEKQAQGAPLGMLHGLPIAHKDLAVTRGIRTTFGSPIYRDHIPQQDALFIERLRHAGAITMGKTNTPEFGAGSQTFNRVFGPTRNPYHTDRTCGGSSGGAAVALACGMVPLADGSDMGGSLRNPANFCNVVGFRTCAGRIPNWPTDEAWFPFSVSGPMARTVEDVALMLSVMAGPDRRDPLSIAYPKFAFHHNLERDFKGVRIAWSDDLGGLPVDTAVTETLHSRHTIWSDLGCEVVDRDPDLKDADRIFKIWRAWRFAMKYGPLLENHRSEIKDTVIWNIEQGQKLTGDDLAWAQLRRTELFQRLYEFMSEFEFLVAPVSQVPPFDIEKPYVTEINSQAMETYIDWMQSCYLITVTGLPTLSVPCGFTPDGLPVGIQIVGRYGDEHGVLQLAWAFQQATQTWKVAPELS